MEQQQSSLQNPSERMKNRDNFNRIMKEVDSLIRQARFHDATVKLVEAKEIDSGNPYVKAFEERIAMAEKAQKGGKPLTPQPPVSPPVSKPPAQPTPVEHQPLPAGQVNTVSPSNERELIEAKLREELENEYSERYTNKIREAEKKAAQVLEQEQEKLKKQRELLRTHYEQGLAEMQQQLAADYQTKLDEEVRLAEERFRKQFEHEQTFFENEMKETLSKHYEAKLQELESRQHELQSALQESEKQSIAEKDKVMKEEYNHKLLDELRKAETAIFQQSEQQQKLEQEKLKERLTKDFEEKLTKERNSLRQEFETQQSKLKQSFEGEKTKLSEEFRRQVEEQVTQARERETKEFEQKRIDLVQRVEFDFKKQFNEQLERERTRIQAESDAALTIEKEKLQQERETVVAREAETIRQTRSELRAEMDKNLMERLEQLQYEYEQKLEMLGISVPTSFEERLTLYREKLRAAYSNGLPTVDQARKIFELKEILELSYEDHMKLDSEARLEQYLRAIENGMTTGSLDVSNIDQLEDLKQKYQILPEEASQIETQMLSRIARHVQKATILIADDEPDIRNGLAETLEMEHYNVISCGGVAEAIEKLKSNKVHLIVSDIKFLPGEPDGFQFFQSVQKFPDLRTIPFILLSSLTDDVIVRSGMQLGVDDYLTKPVNPDLLVAVVQGKLKRLRL